MKAAAPLLSDRRELVTSANWTLLAERWSTPRQSGERRSSARPPDGVPAAATWFSPLMPPGTAYDANKRMFGPKRSLLVRREELERVRALAPYETAPLFELTRIRFGAKPPLASLRANAGLLAEYDITVLSRMADAAAGDAEAYLPIGRRICELDADHCGVLAAYLADHERDREAAEVYGHFVAEARDRVSVSYHASWLISYYDDHGQRPRAIALADEMAEVYSYAGLVAKARLLERMHQFDEAEDYLRKAAARYDNSVDLAAFYLRRANEPNAPTYAELAAPLVKQVFPDGFERVAGGAGIKAPLDGVRVRSSGARGVAAGFSDEDIVVAVDSVRVHNREQLVLVRLMKDDPSISFLTWHGGHYVDIHGPLRHAWVSGDLVSYDYRRPILR
jgi:hypothetical protein